METIQLQFDKGMNNKARSESMPEGTVRAAINVDFDLSGNFRGREGYTSIYTGTDIHSVWKRHFCEGGDLKYLNADNTATTIKTGVGDEPLSYSSIANRIFYSKRSLSGNIVNGNYRGWGITRPARQPDPSISTAGGMFAGDYQIAITWLRNGEESGTINARRITVAEGEGIRLSNFPTAPSDATHVAIYCSSVNGKDLYLYNEYPVSASEIFISKHISDIPLTTQFGLTPFGFDIIQGHYGRVYGVIEDRVYYSNAQNYGLFKGRQRWKFPHKVTLLISVPGSMYVGTTEKIYRISNIDGEGPEVRTVIKEYGAPLHRNIEMDATNTVGYFRSNRGDCMATSEGITELTEANLAMDKYLEVTGVTVLESDGIKKLIITSQGIEEVSSLKATI